MAVDNFMAFKRLMVKRNNELTSQAEAMMSQSEAAPGDKPVEAQAKPSDKDREAMREAYRVAQELERQEEEEMIRKAIEESEALEKQQKAQETEEEEMIRRVMEMSQKEEEERLKRIATLKDQESKAMAESAQPVVQKQPEPVPVAKPSDPSLKTLELSEEQRRQKEIEDAKIE